MSPDKDVKKYATPRVAAPDVKGERILSGMRPTGKLHVGHLWGVLENWKNLSVDRRNKCFFMVADIHALTTEYAAPASLYNLSLEVVKDWLASGIEPDRAVIFRQSDIPEHAELHLYLSMITPLGWLSGCPTYKDQIKELKDRDLHTYGFLGYPLLQASDILLYKATAVPVGEDQLPHIEMTRQVARKFNSLYGGEKGIFPEPKSLITRYPKVPGADGRKMSKSYGNAIYLDDESEVLRKKINSMFTDPEKIKIDDKGHPDGCVVFAFHKILAPGQYATCRHEECRLGRIGCVRCKKELLEFFDSTLAPIREKRRRISDGDAAEILKKGASEAAETAVPTIKEVKKAMGLNR